MILVFMSFVEDTDFMKPLEIDPIKDKSSFKYTIYSIIFKIFLVKSWAKQINSICDNTFV